VPGLDSDRSIPSRAKEMYTASSLFLQTLAEAGITHAFVNWGSDHPGLLEDLERQRIESTDGNTTKPAIITCPNEMVALSAAQGYAQVTGKPAAVIVHVDVGTQVGPL
jgi:thiamine pyrophosphate-dependent acetolactate synthase large subunit-like protein